MAEFPSEFYLEELLTLSTSPDGSCWLGSFSLAVSLNPQAHVSADLHCSCSAPAALPHVLRLCRIRMVGVALLSLRTPKVEALGPLPT